MLVRIPYDNLSKKMTLQEYFEYIHSLQPGASIDPMEAGRGRTNPNIIIDYNAKKDLVQQLKK